MNSTFLNLFEAKLSKSLSVTYYSVNNNYSHNDNEIHIEFKTKNNLYKKLLKYCKDNNIYYEEAECRGTNSIWYEIELDFEKEYENYDSFEIEI
jgi:hypothetical protein